MTPRTQAELVKATARELGFATCGITDLSPPPHATALGRWLREGMSGTMGYMGRQAAKRREPARILPGATRAIVVTRSYPADSEQAPEHPAGGPYGRVARYARGRDYHDALRAPLQTLAERVAELGGPHTLIRWFADAGPVPERELAQRAGLGWIGKNTMLIDPARGSYSFLACLLTDLDLAIDEPFDADRCGTCRACLDACPTDAFPEARVLDARKCISYLTIEYRGAELPEPQAGQLAGWVFGCDVCQEVCPWNVKFASGTADPVLETDQDLAFLELDGIAGLADEEFAARFGHTALSRPGAAGLRRNARALLARPGD